MLEIENLSFAYRKSGNVIFSNFSTRFSPGHIYGLLGPNGAGKTTLLSLMSGLLRPDEGQVTFNDINVRWRKPSTTSDIFIVPDEYELPRVSLSEYIRVNSVFYPRFSHDDLQRYLDVFGMTEDTHLGNLSLGQGKKVFMSFAMATHTRVLLMDEPTNGLDIPGKAQFRKFLTEGRTPESIFVVSTHQVKDIEQVLDHIVMFDNSKILANADMKSIFPDGKIDLERYFNERMNQQTAE
jgi:hypothetical protein